MTKKHKPLPEDFDPETPLMKFVDHDGNVIVTDENGELPDSLQSEEMSVHFYYAIETANEFFERVWWKGDAEEIEIRLFRDSNKGYFWTAKRFNIYDNNRFGDLQKALEDISGILRDVRPLKPIQKMFGVYQVPFERFKSPQ